MFRRQRSFGRANLQVLHAVLDRHVLEGRPFDRLVSERSFGIVWGTLLTPGRPARNLLALGWNLLPSRSWLLRAVTRRAGSARSHQSMSLALAALGFFA